jgi:hypothetical protein
MSGRQEVARLLGLFAATALVAAISSPLKAQIINVNNDTSTPVPASPHDYVKALSETVNPANGSVSR